MNRTIGRFLVLGVLGLAVCFSGRSTAEAQWSWWDGGYYNYGVGYAPYSYGYGYGYYPYSSYYWPSSYYVGYGSYSLGYWPGSCCGGCGTCGGGCGSACGSCGISCCSSGCCGISSCGGGCGVAGCGCGSGCTLACGPSCGCSSGCGNGCGTSTPAPSGKPRPEPDGGFTPRTYDPDAAPPRSNERNPKAPSTSTGGPGPAPAAAEGDTGAEHFSRGRTGDATKAPSSQPPKDNFDLPATKAAPVTPPPGGGAPKDDAPFEAKKPAVPIPQRGADKKAPISTPDDAAPDPGSAKKAKTDNNTDLKKPSAEIENERTRENAPALTLQDRSTWRLTGVSRPLFGRIASRPTPTPERLTSSSGDWAVFSADEAQVVRR